MNRLERMLFTSVFSAMRLPLCSWMFGLGVLGAASIVVLNAQTPELSDRVLTALDGHQYDLDSEGRNLLLAEAGKNDFFLLGEIHGDNEIPELLRALWPAMWKEGYRHVAAEISPWAAYHLEFAPAGAGFEIRGLWTMQQARDLHAPANLNAHILWGCDMEEIQPQFLIRELAALSPDVPSLQRMAKLTKDGYSREMATTLLALAKGIKGARDTDRNDVSLRENLLATLEIDKNRLETATKMIAQNQREVLMKEQLLIHLRHNSAPGSQSKVLFRFGRNHLHRGYDARGISTLGNFVAEFAIAHRRGVDGRH